LNPTGISGEAGWNRCVAPWDVSTTAPRFSRSKRYCDPPPWPRHARRAFRPGRGASAGIIDGQDFRSGSRSGLRITSSVLMKGQSDTFVRTHQS
jgi:hypothetical protein